MSADGRGVALKTRESIKAAAGESSPYASAARPSPGELTKAPPAGPATAESGESPGAGVNHAKLRWSAGACAAPAAVSLVAGGELHAMFLTSLALYCAVAGETRRRVPKLVRVCAPVLVGALGVIMIVLWILEAEGR